MSRARLGIGVVAVGALIAGCGTGDSADPSEPLGFVDVAPTTAVPADPVVRIGVGPIEGVDPSHAREESITELAVADLLYDGLSALDPRTAEPVPSLAESWVVSDDGLTWTFRLSDDATFSDGTPVTSAAVRHTFERLLGHRSEVLAAGALSAVADLEWPDVATIVIRLREPVANLASLLANPVFGIVPENAGDATLDGSEFPVTSGPYAVEQIDDTGLVLVRRPDAGPGEAELRLVPYESEIAAFNGLVDDEVDVAPVPPTRRPTVPAALGLSVSLTPISVFFALNPEAPALADPRVREAVRLAVDASVLVEETMAGWAQPTAWIEGPVCSSPCGASPEMASALVEEVEAEIGAPVQVVIDHVGSEVDTDVGSGLDDQALSEALAEQLAAVGIDAEVRAHTPEELAELLIAGELGIFRWGWVPSQTGSEGVLARLFDRGGVDNVTGYGEEGTDLALREAMAATEAGDQLAYFDTARAGIVDAHVVVPVALIERAVAFDPSIGGLAFDALGHLRLDGLTR